MPCLMSRSAKRRLSKRPMSERPMSERRLSERRVSGLDPDSRHTPVRSQVARSAASIFEILFCLRLLFSELCFDFKLQTGNRDSF